MRIPDPEPGLVLCYSFLWRSEMAAGRTEGRKDRPAVIILRARRVGGRTLVTVLPVTHSPPSNPSFAVEIPPTAKARLGLDQHPSWITLIEANTFIWPGHDIRRRPGSDRCEYGFLSPNLFGTVREEFISLFRSGVAGTVPRD